MDIPLSGTATGTGDDVGRSHVNVAVGQRNLFVECDKEKDGEDGTHDSQQQQLIMDPRTHQVVLGASHAQHTLLHGTAAGVQQLGNLGAPHKRHSGHGLVVADGCHGIHRTVDDLEHTGRDACAVKQLRDRVGGFRNLLGRLEQYATRRTHNAKSVTNEDHSNDANNTRRMLPTTPHDTHQLPMVKAMGTVHMGTMTGKLKGQMLATMPSGSRTSTHVTPRLTCRE